MIKFIGENPQDDLVDYLYKMRNLVSHPRRVKGYTVVEGRAWAESAQLSRFWLSLAILRYVNFHDESAESNTWPTARFPLPWNRGFTTERTYTPPEFI